ncbi:hypothetical protein PSTEL_20740 [Paenibacillus stellifer]|uniref:Copper amine oxidase-like N-terminal domain-containing protein n=1 Tax=Paenibacillus stellifer TaxID=169760 RepID=A0A089LUH2_9BACL|nr:stalk domain-containing protein [Paenibacillus stellifer]AIQ65186.1 hypothetical protein PSTEL_20740 [Paenibacillus stellifer]
MKKSQWLSVLMTSVLLTTAVSASVQAASGGSKAPVQNTAAKTAKVKEGQASWTINGAQATLKTIEIGGYKLYALGQLTTALGASLTSGTGSVVITDAAGLHTITLKAGSKSYTVDGTARSFTTAPTVSGGKLYVELSAIVYGLGGELYGSPLEILSAARPQGEFSTPQWAADGTILATLEGDAEQMYKLSATPGTYRVLESDGQASGFAVSADRSQGAFTDETGQLYVINLSNGQIKALGTDTSVKTDLAWAADGKTLYFVQGDKQEKLAKVSVDTGEITTVLADKVENKSELGISPDGTKAVYIVNITGTAKNDADSTEDSLTVDYSKAGEQLYTLDLTAKDAAPAAITTSDDNKLYPEIANDGTVTYLSADPNGNALNTLKSVKTDKTAANLQLDIEPNWIEQAGSSLVVSGTAADGSSRIYSIAATGAKTELFRTTESVSEVAVSADGSKLAVTINGKLWEIVNGKAVQLTK